MDNRQYQYQALVDIVSGGYDGEEHGVTPADPTPIVTNNMSGNRTYQYYYRDSRLGTNSDSSRVVITVNDQWTANIDNRNVLTVTCHTIITSIVRDSLIPGPGQVSAGSRNLYLYGEQGPNYTGIDFKRSFLGDSISTAHTISNTPIDIGTNVLTIQPGQTKGRGTVYIINWVTGTEGQPIPDNPNVDAMYIGTYFTNILPPDYRPGAIVGADGQWYSHNRDGGARDIYNGSSWQTLRTIDGGVGAGNPPSIAHNDNNWKNQRLIGLGK